MKNLVDIEKARMIVQKYVKYDLNDKEVIDVKVNTIYISSAIKAVKDAFKQNNTELSQLREALQEMTDLLDDRCKKYGMSPMEFDVLEKAKQLLNNES